jgi:c-di-GMP-binding flagellar brake protein YcgR
MVNDGEVFRKKELSQRASTNSYYLHITDLSPGGCRFFCYAPVPVKIDETIKIYLKLKNWEDDIRMNAQIIRVKPFNYIPYAGSKEEINSELGVRFLKITEGQKKVIENYTKMVLGRIKKGAVRLEPDLRRD